MEFHGTSTGCPQTQPENSIHRFRRIATPTVLRIKDQSIHRQFIFTQSEISIRKIKMILNIRVRGTCRCSPYNQSGVRNSIVKHTDKSLLSISYYINKAIICVQR